ncbi:MAG: hypothetical protein K6G00_12750 [Treponema sp.]|nr:hypothetical protein [Treponema sp.]
MKLEKRFLSKDNRLYKIDGTECSVSDIPALKGSACINEQAAQSVSSFSCIEVEWSLIGCNEESYNEEFLAGFRDFLKVLDEKQLFVFIIPVADKMPSSPEEKNAFVASMKHCARRIKDCISVVGFALPASDIGIEPSFFIEELSEKHSHYVFFSKEDSVLKDFSIVKY